jgi:hypothetical protein
MIAFEENTYDRPPPTGVVAPGTTGAVVVVRALCASLRGVEYRNSTETLNFDQCEETQSRAFRETDIRSQTSFCAIIRDIFRMLKTAIFNID